MKKAIVFVMALALSAGVYAQNLKYGVKAGLNLSSVSEVTEKEGNNKDTRDGSDMLAGFFAAAHLNYSFSDLLGIQPELMFSMQGGAYEGDVTVRLNYINIPVLLDIKPFTNFSILVGPQIGFNVYKSQSVGGESVSGSDLTDMMKAGGRKLNAIDFAAVVGVQYAIMDHFLVSARYNFGFTKTILSDTDGAEISGGRNGVIQIGVGYQF